MIAPICPRITIVLHDGGWDGEGPSNPDEVDWQLCVSRPGQEMAAYLPGLNRYVTPLADGHPHVRAGPVADRSA